METPGFKRATHCKKSLSRCSVIGFEPSSVARKIDRTLASAGKKLMRVKMVAGDLTGLGAESQIRRMPPSEYMNDVQLEFFRRRLQQMRVPGQIVWPEGCERLHLLSSPMRRP